MAETLVRWAKVWHLTSPTPGRTWCGRALPDRYARHAMIPGTLDARTICRKCWGAA